MVAIDRCIQPPKVHIRLAIISWYSSFSICFLYRVVRYISHKVVQDDHLEVCTSFSQIVSGHKGISLTFTPTYFLSDVFSNLAPRRFLPQSVSTVFLYYQVCWTVLTVPYKHSFLTSVVQFLMIMTVCVTIWSKHPHFWENWLSSC